MTWGLPSSSSSKSLMVKPGNGFPVLGGVGVDGDEMRAGAERRRPLLVVFFLLGVDEETGGSQGQTQNGRDAAHGLSGWRWQRRLYVRSGAVLTAGWFERSVSIH